MSQNEPTNEEQEAELQRIAAEDEWHDAMMSLYTWDEGGNCDGFTKY